MSRKAAKPETLDLKSASSYMSPAFPAGWQSGYAEDCKSSYSGSIPLPASTLLKGARRMAAKQPQVGQRYRHVGTAFRNAVWILSEIFTGRDGIEHARLTSAYDSSQSKTVALSVVADTRRFTLVDQPEKTTL